MNKQERDELRALYSAIFSTRHITPTTINGVVLVPVGDAVKVIESVPTLLDEIERLEAEIVKLRHFGKALAIARRTLKGGQVEDAEIVFDATWYFIEEDDDE